MIAQQAPLFSLAEGRRRRDAGIAKAASGHEAWLADARNVAEWICQRKGECSVNDLYEYGIRKPAGASHNIWGSVFRDARFVSTGRTVPTLRAMSHSRRVFLWRLR